ncbi:hypothetical protein B0A50_00809 [Salinomyces thailandicus]|uniref:ATP-dependent RNA helicase n=1 Tax=Salinomyces thailandicus TaxID=706561 RepID=A0A4U0UF66_9PEZI|nr:hypothetical protein B0A50_00809 [Salinomyces thailandica]
MKIEAATDSSLFRTAMDPLRLLSRSTTIRNANKKNATPSTPSGGQNAQPQLFPTNAQHSTTVKKRKRGRDAPDTIGDQEGSLDFFGSGSSKAARLPQVDRQNPVSKGYDEASVAGEQEEAQDSTSRPSSLTDGEVRTFYRQHKLKMMWLNGDRRSTKEGRKKAKHEDKVEKAKRQIFPQPLQSFRELEQQNAMSTTVVKNITDQGYHAPTEVQLGALPLLLDSPSRYLPNLRQAAEVGEGDIDLLTVAPTGSGKTLAFMIPLIHKVLAVRQKENQPSKSTLAIILAPTKELVSQTVNEGRKLAAGTSVRITQLRKGMRLDVNEDQPRSQSNIAEKSVVKADIIVSTPGTLQSLLQGPSGSGLHTLPTVLHLVLDEADVLLDPLFREQTEGIWNALTNPSLRVGLWSATMGSNIEELARSNINMRRERIDSVTGRHLAEAPLVRLVVGLKDSAVPNIDHRLIYAANEQGKLMGLRQLLHPNAPSKDTSLPLLPPFLVFTQTIERAIALHSELMYDIPAEAGGISRIAVLHSDLTDKARDSIMTRFRKGEIWVLITTDLLSRGVDFRGVNGVVNYDLPTSSAGYVHRVGRTGRAGREGGVAVTLYSKEDIPYLKHVANVVAMAQKQADIKDGSGVQQWLLDALPSLNKQEKQKLKKHGIESRTAHGNKSDPKAGKKTKISSKSGFIRKEENKRKGAIAGSKRRQQADATSDAGDETDFGGFD